MLHRFPCIFTLFRGFFTQNPCFRGYFTQIVFLTSFLLGLYCQNPREKGGAYSSGGHNHRIVLLFLLLLWNTVRKIEHLPSGCHHVVFILVFRVVWATIFDGIFRCCKDWDIMINADVGRVMILGSWQIHLVSFEQ